MEKRLIASQVKSSPLPLDYLKLVSETFNTTFKKNLKKGETFEAHGEVHPDEVVLAVSLIGKDTIAATTVYASIDFSPKANGIESVQELLNSSVDAIGTVFDVLKIETLVNTSLNDIENAPFEWTPITIEKNKVFVKIDKTNLRLDQAANDWLAKNDPNFADLEREEQKQMEDLFVTGPRSASKKASDDDSGSTVH